MTTAYMCQGCGTELPSWTGKCPACGNTEYLSVAKNVDRMIGRLIKNKYKIISRLGQGGMGAVYLAEQSGIGQKVALKFLRSEFSDDTEITRRFLNEAKSYVRVSHPSAVMFHDLGQEEDGSLFIVMEFVEGVDLKKMITDARRLPVNEAIEIVQQVADVLSHAHSKGVVHRDLKPENIMVRRGLRLYAKVLDFGIARLADAGTKLTVQGAIAGTPRYMAPEQIDGLEIDHRIDIYALGIVLYECLTGQQPFDGTTINEILKKQKIMPMPLLRDASPDLDYGDLDRVIQTATAKNRDERFANMEAFNMALSRALPTLAHIQPNISLVGSFGKVPTSGPDNLSGVARPGSDVSTDDVTARTLMRSPTALGASTQLQDIRPADSRPADFSMPPKVPKSNGPIIALAVIGVLAVGGAVAVFASGGKAKVDEHTTTATTTTTAVEPPTQVDAGAVAAVAPVDVNAQVVQEAARLLAEQSALNKLSDANTQFELGNLDNCETYLRGIAPDTKSAVPANEMLEKIQKIREKLKVADSARIRGDYERAVPVYNEILKINPHVAAAVRGRQECLRGGIDSRME